MSNRSFDDPHVRSVHFGLSGGVPVPVFVCAKIEVGRRIECLGGCADAGVANWGSEVRGRNLHSSSTQTQSAAATATTTTTATPRAVGTTLTTRRASATSRHSACVCVCVRARISVCRF